MDGFTYENTAGGWSVCDICGVRVSNEVKHAEWHQALTMAVQAAKNGWEIFFAWNTPQRKEPDRG